MHIVKKITDAQYEVTHTHLNTLCLEDARDRASKR